MASESPSKLGKAFKALGSLMTVAGVACAIGGFMGAPSFLFITGIVAFVAGLLLFVVGRIFE